MDKESAEKRLLEIHGENSFFMNSPYVTLSFAKIKNETKLKMLLEISNSEDPMKALEKLITEEIEIQTDLEFIDKKATDLFG
jgi:hypothetical protein